MKILILFSIFIIASLLIGRKFFNSAKRNLFKDQSAWSGKDIKIKYSDAKEISSSKETDNYLNIIADEAKIYLEDTSMNEDHEETK